MRRVLSVCTGLAIGFAALPALAVGGGSSADPAPPPSSATVKPLWQEAQRYYSTLAAPTFPSGTEPEAVDGPRAAAGRPTVDDRADRSTGFPPAARELARREAEAQQDGVSPRRSLRRTGADPVVRAKLLTILAEFDPEANDDFSG